MPASFDAKLFNAEVFQEYMSRIENPNATMLVKSKAIRSRPDLATALTEQTGGNLLTTPMLGLISGAEAENYDGKTDPQATSTITYQQTRVVVGRQHSWVEKDFAYDITGGTDFMENVAAQLVDWVQELDQTTIMAIMDGVFSMPSVAGKKFVERHTYNITQKYNSENQIGLPDAASLNTAMQRACGDKKAKFSVAIMHSTVSTGLENLKILKYIKYTDSQGMERDITIATLNGRLVLVDDGMPVYEGYYTAKEGDEGALKIIASGSAADGEVLLSEVQKGKFYPKNAAANNYVIPGEMYTTYAFGDGAIEMTDAGVKVPVEMDRDPKTNGGQDTLYYRQRKAWAPRGITFTKKSMLSNSPTDAELAKGTNWDIVNGVDAKDQTVYISDKVIPIARILSRG